MLPLNPHVENRLMIIPLPPRPLQPLHFLIFQPPPYHILQLLPTNLLPRLGLLARLQPRLETRLHPDAERRVERDVLRIPSYLRPLVRLRRHVFFGDSQKLLALRLDRERAGRIGGRDAEEGFFGRDGFAGGGQDAEFVAGEIPTSPPLDISIFSILKRRSHPGSAWRVINLP